MAAPDASLLAFVRCLSAPRTDVLGYSQPDLSKLAFFHRPIWTALTENKSAIRVCRNSPAEPALPAPACRGSSSKGTAESSPGRQSWVYFATETSPEGTAENAPGRESWVNPSAHEC